MTKGQHGTSDGIKTAARIELVADNGAATHHCVQNSTNQRLANLPAVPERSWTTDFHGFVGTSLSMRKAYDLIKSAAVSTVPIFITGESGTGKEVAAEAIHAESRRANEPFEALNCAAIPGELMESALFGHNRGAFTGATQNQPGAAQRADGGTLFLDELCELPLELQSKLLRFLQTGCVQKVGATQPTTVDVRIVCATNVDPIAALQEGRLREDLFYRLFVVPLQLPPLRRRGDDILLLAQHFLRHNSRVENRDFAGFDAATQDWLLAHHWPGNVRELQNLIRNLVIMNEGPVVTRAMLDNCCLTGGEVTNPAPYRSSPPDEQAGISQRHNPTGIAPLWEQERASIERAIEFYDGNVMRAAAALEISPSTIYRKKVSWPE